MSRRVYVGHVTCPHVYFGTILWEIVKIVYSVFFPFITQPKHKNQKRNKETQRETQGNRFDHKFGLLCLPERDPKLKHTKTGFILKPKFPKQ